MEKISNAQAGEMMKMASAKIRTLAAQNTELEGENAKLNEKLAHYAKKDRAENIAALMEEKGLQPELSLQEKVAGLMKRDNLSVVEEAVGLSTPQMKLASVSDDGESVDDGDGPALNSAENMFAQGLVNES